MGLIQKQTIRGTTYSFLGVIIGFVNLVILSPLIFTSDQIGLTQVMVAISSIISQLGSLGFNNVTNRLFPYFREPGKGHKGYLSLATLITIFGFIIALIFMSIYMPSFIERNQVKSELLSEYAYYIPVLVAALMLFNLLDNYCKVLFNAVLGTMLRELVLRSIVLLIVLLFYFQIIDFDTYVLIFTLSYALPSIVMVIYLISKGEFIYTGFRTFLSPYMVKQMLSLSLFGIVAGLSGIAITSIDKYMVNDFQGLSDAGIYSIAVYFATLILIPARSLGKIAIPVMSEAWKRNDTELIQNIYHKSSINQMVIGLLIFVGIIANLNNIYRILPQEYSKGEMVIVLFGFANLISVTAGACKIILSTSAHYKYMTYLMLILILLVIVSNLIFIPIYGITGAAIASLISMFFYTGLNVWVLWKFYRLWPFNFKHLILLLFSLVIYLLSTLLPEMKVVVDIFVRSMLIIIVFGAALVVFKVSDEVITYYQTITGFVKKVRAKLK